ncbi:MAG: hypothetical protein Q4C13_02170 [Clostridia bacterium]|nr:hypothetical protein [Clostridia bacterium]
MTKADERRAGIAARRAVPPETRARFDAAIRRLELCPAFQSAGSVLCYRAFGGEPDLAGLNARGKLLAFPWCEDEAHMRALVPGARGFISGRYGIE